jgi:hypothetical protein
VVQFMPEFTFPADMLAHWALFHIGGNAGHNGQGLVCHRCKCTYAKLGRVFTQYEVQPEDTLEIIAKKHGQSVAELRDNNPDDDDAYENQLRFLDWEWECSNHKAKGAHSCKTTCVCYFSNRNVRLKDLADDEIISQAMAIRPIGDAIPGTVASRSPQTSANAKKKKKTDTPPQPEAKVRT